MRDGQQLDAGRGRRLEARPSLAAGAAAGGGAGLSGKWETHGTSRGRGAPSLPESVGLRRQEREPRPLQGLPLDRLKTALTTQTS